NGVRRHRQRPLLRTEHLDALRRRQSRGVRSRRRDREPLAGGTPGTSPRYEGEGAIAMLLHGHNHVTMVLVPYRGPNSLSAKWRAATSREGLRLPCENVRARRIRRSG